MKINKITKNFLRENKLDQYLNKKYLDYFIVAFSLLLGFYLRWELQNITLFSFTVWMILNPISSRLLARVALGFLFFVPLLLIIKITDWAEQFAIFAFYFLVLAVIIIIIEFKKRQIIVTGRSKKNSKRKDYGKN